jgi:carotenoid cleavage dioxygenase
MWHGGPGGQAHGMLWRWTIDLAAGTVTEDQVDDWHCEFPRVDDRPGGAGWLITFVYDQARNASDLVIVDATDLAAPPRATVALPRRVPFGFHGNWLPDA